MYRQTGLFGSGSREAVLRKSSWSLIRYGHSTTSSLFLCLPSLLPTSWRKTLHLRVRWCRRPATQALPASAASRRQETPLRNICWTTSESSSLGREVRDVETCRQAWSSWDSRYWWQERQPACKKPGVGLLVVMFWLELCTSYSSSCYHRLRHL